MALLQRMTLLITFALFAPGLLADGLAGMWKNAEQPAWIGMLLGFARDSLRLKKTHVDTRKLTIQISGLYQ